MKDNRTERRKLTIPIGWSDQQGLIQCDMDNISGILVYGSAGQGKTTFCRNFILNLNQIRNADCRFVVCGRDCCNEEYSDIQKMIPPSRFRILSDFPFFIREMESALKERWQKVRMNGDPLKQLPDSHLFFIVDSFSRHLWDHLSEEQQYIFTETLRYCIHTVEYIGIHVLFTSDCADIIPRDLFPASVPEIFMWYPLPVMSPYVGLSQKEFFDRLMMLAPGKFLYFRNMLPPVFCTFEPMNPDGLE